MITLSTHKGCHYIQNFGIIIADYDIGLIARIFAISVIYGTVLAQPHLPYSWTKPHRHHIVGITKLLRGHISIQPIVVGGGVGLAQNAQPSFLAGQLFFPLTNHHSHQQHKCNCTAPTLKGDLNFP